MAFLIKEALMGMPPIGSISASAVVTPGTIVRADDPGYGSGEFIFLQGVASTVLGSIVNWGGLSGSNLPTFQTALLPSTANLACPVAFATAAILAGQYGWYQVSGVAVAAATVMAGAGVVGIGLTAGIISSTLVAGKQILNAASLVAVGTPAAGQTLVQINRPFAQGAIT
jgi:hypothetical protein